MAKVPIPFTDQKVNTDQPMNAAVMILLLIAGFAVFAFARMVGSTGAQRVSDYIAQVTGVNPATGQSQQSTGPGVV